LQNRELTKNKKMAEESKLVDEVVETTESKEVQDKFNPLAFNAEENNYGETEETEEKEETTEEVESKNEEQEQEQEDGWAWDSKDTESEVKEEDDYNWEGTEKKTEEKTEEAPTTEEALTWAKVGKELGLEINSKDEFLNTVNSYAKELQEGGKTQNNSQVAELRGYLNYNDRDLVSEELKADGIEESQIEESLDKLEDSGMLIMKAKSIRRTINNAIDQQTDANKNKIAQEDNQRKESAKQAKEKLKSEIKDMKEFMGGKVTKKQKEEVYRYATNNMMKDIYASHANVADVAMFMLYRKQIEKILRSQGLEDGKAAIMDSIVSPSLNTGKSKSNFKVKSGEFDPKAFMSE
tara:strand:- start:54 stop:1106 length:1053 start_codon:yes stop_codon:yes gene_type:complete